MFWKPVEPKTPLGRYRPLSKHSSVHVSPVALGAMSIGDQWEGLGFGTMNKEISIRLLDAYYEAGGNFIDTSCNYQNGSSESFIGEWMESKGIRDQMFVATKYSFNFVLHEPSIQQKVMYHGNNAKAMRLALESSLKRLRTNFVDLLYVHVWDFETSIQEVMDNLHKLVLAEKVLYLGISDTPAWIVSQCNQYALDHGKTPFSVYQGSWNVMDRALERDIIPMARAHGMALCPFDILANGKLRSDAEEERREKSGEKGRDLGLDNQGWKRTEEQKRMTDALEKVAKEVGIEDGVSPVAIAYLMHKTTFVFPIVGGRKTEHLEQNIKALNIRLTPEQISYLESIIPFEAGYPHNYTNDGSQDNGMNVLAAKCDRMPFQAPILPPAKEA